MAVDKLVDSSKLNAALDYEASKIIAKGGGTAPLAFDLENEKGFGDYIDAIPSGGGIHNLPSGYTEYAFIESTGTQYINTGYVAKENSKITSVHVRTVSQGNQVCEWGSKDTPNMHCQNTFLAFGSITDKSFAGFVPNSMGGYYSITIDKNGLRNIYGTVVAAFGTYTWTSGNNPIYLFARNNGNVAERFSKARMYYWVAYEDGVKKAEFIPAMRDADSTLGFYETVSGHFYTNDGSGTFVGGSY